MKMILNKDGYTVFKTLKNGKPHMFIVNENEFESI